MRGATGRFSFLALACLLISVVAGCGDKGASGGNSGGKSARPKVTLLTVGPDGRTVHSKTVLVSGKVSEPNAFVAVEGKPADADESGAFRVKVKLDVGDNFFDITASKPGFESASQTIAIERVLSAAERRARAERKRLKREAEIAELRSSAKQLDPDLLQKDPDRYTGEQVVMSGEIFQIQEGGNNFFLMNTKCNTEYGTTLCDGPEVYVSYDFATDKTEDDIVTVYGEVQGGYEYDTQIGGSNYVGHIRARIIE
jgi:hypothetical protein